MRGRRCRSRSWRWSSRATRAENHRRRALSRGGTRVFRRRRHHRRAGARAQRPPRDLEGVAIPGATCSKTAAASCSSAWRRSRSMARSRRPSCISATSSRYFSQTTHSRAERGDPRTQTAERTRKTVEQPAHREECGCELKLTQKGFAAADAQIRELGGRDGLTIGELKKRFQSHAAS